MNSDQISDFEKIASQLSGIHSEMSALSKKSPNDAVNKFKIKFINALLARALTVLGPENHPLEDFREFEIDELPSNSDVCFITSQYLERLEQLRSENIYQKYDRWYWSSEDDEDSLPTSPPKKILKK